MLIRENWVGRETDSVIICCLRFTAGFLAAPPIVIAWNESRACELEQNIVSWKQGLRNTFVVDSYCDAYR